MALPFGKTIKTRHFTVLKFSKSLSKKEVASLREDIQGGRIKMRSPPKVLTGNFRPSQLSFFLS